jgi:hypothetical protein
VLRDQLVVPAAQFVVVGPMLVALLASRLQFRVQLLDLLRERGTLGACGSQLALVIRAQLIPLFTQVAVLDLKLVVCQSKIVVLGDQL